MFLYFLMCQNAQKSISVLTAPWDSTRVRIYSFLGSFASERKLPCKVYSLPSENAYCAKVSSDRSESVRRPPGTVNALFDKRRYLNRNTPEEIDDHKAQQGTFRAARDTLIAGRDA